MRNVFRHILGFTFTVCCALYATACIADHYPCDPDGEEAYDGNLLVLHISPVSRSADGAGAVTEKIRSLRIIVMGKDNAGNKTSVEYNKLLTLPGEVSASKDFSYALTLPVTAGKKDIWLFANEESVTGIRYEAEEGVQLPDGLPTTKNLADLMEHYKVEGSGLAPNTETTPDPEGFSKALRAVWFAPQYDIEEDGSVFLPYASCYTDISGYSREEREQAGNDNLVQTLYLVPVATKFTFNFTNYRSNPVEINEITVDEIHSDNFLLAQVGPAEEYKEFDGTELWWIDWLAKVSEASHGSPGYADNTSFNERYGWIADYALPALARQSESHRFVQREKTSSTPPYTVARKDETSAEPGKCSLGPFYLPESRHEVTYDMTVKDENGQDIKETVTEQIWYLTLKLHDTASSPGADPFFDKVPVSNLNSLFRNTSVTVNVTLREGDVEIYAEIHDWNEKSANGWVTGGEDSAPLPDNPAS